MNAESGEAAQSYRIVVHKSFDVKMTQNTLYWRDLSSPFLRLGLLPRLILAVRSRLLVDLASRLMYVPGSPSQGDRPDPAKEIPRSWDPPRPRCPLCPPTRELRLLHTLPLPATILVLAERSESVA